MKVVKSLDYEGQKWYIPVLKKLHLEVNYKVLFKALKDLKYISDMKYLKVQTQAYVTYYYSLEHSLTHSLEASIAKLCTRLHYASMFRQRCPRTMQERVKPCSGGWLVRWEPGCPKRI